MEETSEVGDGRGDETTSVGSDYDVFLSFRGPDTRHGINDHLYESMTDKGVRVFRDDEEIRRGEEIGDELKRAIHISSVYVVVFSKNYASSAWCLRELAMIVDCCGDSTAGRIVLPIFYDVDPHDVKLRTYLYRSALDKHRGRYGEEVVKRWEEALVKVGGISGWDYKDFQGEGKFVRLVVQDVMNKLKIRDRRLPHHLIGIDAGVEGVMKLLNCDSPEVRVVMAHGMGGIGKTTLANVIFNRISSKFNGCSYLADVRESSISEGGIAKLQKRLLGDILGGPITEIGDSSDVMNQIQRRLGGKSVLIIFDDVSERHQLNEMVGNCDFFGSGTRIIVTTRDKTVCKGLMRSGDVYTYEMEEMSDDHALQLFSSHAFGGERSPVNFADLSKQVVRTSGNLPLALQVIGGHLCGESKDVWEYTLQKLQRVPDRGVTKVLRISYEGLEEREKQIFLDIACFSIEMPRRYASYMWEACGLYPKWGVAILQNKSLLKILRNEEFWMHDLIRDMGREIVCAECLQSLEMRSRLWDPKDALCVVHQKNGTNNVLAINLGELPDGHHLVGEEFEGMSNLRFLQLCGGQFIGNFRNIWSKLLWLRWEDCRRGPNHAFFDMNNLVVLEISGPGITDESMKHSRMGNLRDLKIALSEMTTMPDLCRCSKLERIILEDCFQLETFHSSIGMLEGLTSLHIKNCEALRSLSEELGSAKALRELTLTDCPSFEELPESIGRLGALRVLRVMTTKIRKIPASVGNLKSLEVLQFQNCPLDEGIPEEIGGLSSLEELNLEGCGLRQLPGTIHQLSRLRSLFLSSCYELRELPDLSSLINLTEMVLKDCGTVLEGTSSHVHPLQSPNLAMIHGLQRSTSRIPLPPSTELGSLSRLPSSLRWLRLWQFRTAVSWAQYYYNLRFLHRLELYKWMVTEIRLGGLDLFWNLGNLSIGYSLNLVKLSDLACLRRLSSLDLIECPRLVDISGLEKMELLEELTIFRCDSLSRIPDLSGSWRLKCVRISACRSLFSVPSMIGECYLNVMLCPKLGSFTGPYRQYSRTRREAGST